MGATVWMGAAGKWRSQLQQDSVMLPWLEIANLLWNSSFLTRLVFYKIAKL
jgi:hypothetical protein